MRHQARPAARRRHSSRQQKDLPKPGYTVGYGRPPKHTQFPPGHSGNRRGRRKKRESLQDIVANVLFEKMEVRIGERTRKMASVNALMRTAVSRALKGDYKFLMAVLAFIRLSGLSDVAGDALVAGTDQAADEAILADFLRRQGVVIPTASSVPGKSHRTTKKANAREDGDESS